MGGVVAAAPVPPLRRSLPCSAALRCGIFGVLAPRRGGFAAPAALARRSSARRRPRLSGGVSARSAPRALSLPLRPLAGAPPSVGPPARAPRAAALAPRRRLGALAAKCAGFGRRSSAPVGLKGAPAARFPSLRSVGLRPARFLWRACAPCPRRYKRSALKSCSPPVRSYRH